LWWWVGVCVCTRMHIRTLLGVLNLSPGVGQTPGEPGESRSTKALYTCKLYKCTKVHLSIQKLGCRVLRVSNPIPGILVCDLTPRILEIEMPGMGSCLHSAKCAWDRLGGGCLRPGLFQPPPGRSHAHFAEREQETIPGI